MEDGVRHRNRSAKVRIQIWQSATDDQALVDDRPRRRRRNRDLGHDAAGRPGSRLEASASNDQPPFERVVAERPVILGRPGRARNDRLRECRARFGRRRSKRGKVDRHFTPGSDRQSGLAKDALDKGTRASLDRPASWQEQRHDPRSARGLAPSEQLEERTVERKRHPGSVARLAVGSERAAVSQRSQPGKG